jgi:hypothetical protein
MFDHAILFQVVYPNGRIWYWAWPEGNQLTPLGPDPSLSAAFSAIRAQGWAEAGRAEVTGDQVPEVFFWKRPHPTP